MIKKNTLLALFMVLQLTQSAIAAPADDFVITVKTDNPGDSTNLQFEIPTLFGYTYNYNVDCNDDGIDEIGGATGDYVCNYASTGTYTIRIKDNTGTNGGFPQIYFNGGGDKDKILTLEQWGTNKWANMIRAFKGATNLTIPAIDAPDLLMVTNMFGMFSDATSANPDTSLWDTSSVTDMFSMFRNARSANPNTSNWDVSSVTSMSRMFAGATSANPDTGNWDTSSVTRMDSMFSGANSANPNTSNWNTSFVTNMDSMFRDTTSANPDTSNWNVSSVIHMRFMFGRANSANPNTSNWNTSSVINMSSMFFLATSANPDTSLWDIGNVTLMDNMFTGVALPTVDYDAMLIGFNSQNLQTGVNFGGGNSVYCSAAATVAQDNLQSISGHNWTITDGGSCGIFADSFEQIVTTFKAGEGFVEYDFNKLPTLPLDEKPVLVAQGLDVANQPVIEIHLRRVEGETLIRVSFLDLEEIGGNENELSTHEQWQVLENKGLTILYW